MSHQPDNISAGTQVVSLVEVRGTNNSLVHPRGAVGVVTRTPAVAGEKFLIRFPDGFEASLTRNQLDILKHFKDRLGPPNSRPPQTGTPVSDPARADLEIRAPSTVRRVTPCAQDSTDGLLRTASSTFDLAKILQSKREFRQDLAARPVEQKLAMLDALRERTLAIRPARPEAGAGAPVETAPPYPIEQKQCPYEGLEVRAS